MFFYPPSPGSEREAGILRSAFRRKFQRRDGYLVCTWDTVEFAVLPCENCGGHFAFMRPEGHDHGVRGACYASEDEAFDDLFRFSAINLETFLGKLREAI
jgi:hypothetical protein